MGPTRRESELWFKASVMEDALYGGLKLEDPHQFQDVLIGGGGFDGTDATYSAHFVQNDVEIVNETSFKKPTISGEFARVDLWASQYHRNNKSMGLKNLRCFPHCTDGQHREKGFCGASLKVMLTCHDGDGSFAKNMVVFAEFGKAVADKGGLMVGKIVTEAEITKQERTQDHPFGRWIRGSLKDELENENGKASALFEFAHGKRGWHYGFHANKHLSRLLHCVRTYALLPIGGNRYMCVSMVSSPSFTLTCRRKNPALPEPVDDQASEASCDSGSTGSKKRKQAGEEASSVRYYTRVVANLLKVPTEVFESNLNQLASRNDMGPSSSSSSSTGSAVSKRRRRNTIKDEEDHPGDETAAEENSSHVARDHITREALHALANYLVREHDLTDMVQKMLEENPGSETTDSARSIVRALQQKFAQFLAERGSSLLEAYHFNAELMPEAFDLPPSKSPHIGVVEFDMEKISKQVDEQQPILVKPKKNTAVSASTNTSESTLSASRESINPAMGAIPLPSTMASRMVGFVGTWERSTKLLEGMDRFYTAMGWSWLMRKLILLQAKRFSVVYDHLSDHETLTLFHKRKLLSSGCLAYKFDTVPRQNFVPAPLFNSPLLLETRCYFSESKHALVCENYFAKHRITRYIDLPQNENEEFNIWTVHLTLEEQILSDKAPNGYEYVKIDEIKDASILRVCNN